MRYECRVFTLTDLMQRAESGDVLTMDEKNIK